MYNILLLRNIFNKMNFCFLQAKSHKPNRLRILVVAKNLLFVTFYSDSCIFEDFI